MSDKKKYNYFYKITNLINNHFYYGIHSTNNLDDGYMGSGYRLLYAYKKYGIENFSKEILKYFDTREECAQYEAEVVTENLILDDNCYNIVLGGEGWNTLNLIPVLDLSTNIKTMVHRDVYDKNRERYELFGSDFSRTIFVRKKDDTDCKYFMISLEEYYKNKDEYISYSSETICVKDKAGKLFRVKTDDPRYLAGDLVFIWKGKKHTEETKEKIKKRCQDTNFHKGETNPMFGKVWVNKDKTSLLINKSELDDYINNGWLRGKYHIIVIDKSKPTIEELNNSYFELNSWVKVAEKYHMTISALKHLRRKYKQLNKQSVL